MIKKVVLAGGSGFLGQALAKFLINKGYEVGCDFIKKIVNHLDEWAHEIDGSFAVVNFTGKSVNFFYTKSNREEIITSRIDSVRVLEEAIKTVPFRLKLLSRQVP